MNPEKILKQIRDNRDAEYSLIVAMAGCLSRLVASTETYDIHKAFNPQLVTVIEDARRILKRGDSSGLTSADCQRLPKPVMRSG